MAIRAYAAMKAGGNLGEFSYEPKELGPFDIEISINHCGVCHSDVHLVQNDWQMSEYPLVPGHEIIGTISAKGDLVQELDTGQRVGIGWQRGACLQCRWCLSGQENLCPHQQATCVGNHGGFAEAIRIDSRFVYPIPDRLPSESTGPLLCAGITVFSPMRHYRIEPPMKVGVIGIGGLGHLAVQYARAFGCEVTAFTSSPEKEREIMEFGAGRVVDSTDTGELEKMADTQDFILSTVYVNLDWSAYLNVLSPNGTLCIVGAPDKPVSLPAFPLVIGQKRVGGSVIGGRHMMREMLEFSARHSILPKIERLPMDRVNDALARVEKGEARYRIVLDR